MIYVYRFTDVDERELVEVSQPMGDDALTEVDGRPVRRVYAAPRFGWSGGFAPALEDFWNSGDPDTIRGKGQ